MQVSVYPAKEYFERLKFRALQTTISGSLSGITRSKRMNSQKWNNPSAQTLFDGVFDGMYCND
jgi:hypothetical protein